MVDLRKSTGSKKSVSGFQAVAARAAGRGRALLGRGKIRQIQGEKPLPPEAVSRGTKLPLW